MSQAPDITEPLHDILKEYPQGLSEYQLITRLKQPDVGVLSARLSLADPLCLFQTHFYVFHQLYQLRNQLREQQQGDMTISASLICLRPFTPGTKALGESDSLAAYYLDWHNFDNTGKEDVNALLNDFWQRMAGQVPEEERRQALAELDLPENASVQQIRRRYRTLIHKYHPDKGGDTEVTRKLNAAYRKLL